MKTILITGTSGALGNKLREYFMERGYDVIGTVGKSKPRYNESPINLGDWNSFRQLRDVLGNKQLHAVIHNAAILHGKAGIKKMYAANVTGTENVLRLAHEFKCRNFIQISTIGVYGIHSLGKNRNEDTCPIDIEPYGITKKIAEKRILASEIPNTILRLPLLKYGGDFYIERPIKKGRSVFIKKKELNIISTVTPDHVAITCEYIIKNGPLNDVFNCASHHQSWRDMITDHCKHEGIKITNTKRVSVFGAATMGLVIGVIALFGQHTPSTKIDKLIHLP